MPFVVRVEVQLADVSFLLSVLQLHVLVFVRLDLSVYDELLNFHKVFQPLLFMFLHSVVFLAPCRDPVRFLQGVPLPGAIIYVTLSLRHNFLFSSRARSLFSFGLLHSVQSFQLPTILVGFTNTTGRSLDVACASSICFG